VRGCGADQFIAEIVPRRTDRHYLHVLAEWVVELPITRANLVLDPFVAQQIVTGELSDDQNRAAGPNTRPSGNSPANWSRELCQSEGLGLPSRRHFCQPPFSTLALSNPKTRNSYQTRHAQYAFWAL
jgi:hypothetical protein